MLVPGVRKNSETLLKKLVNRTDRHAKGDDVPGIGPDPERHGEKTLRSNKRLTAELWITYFALVATFLATSLLLWDLIGIYSNSLRSGDIWSVFIFLVLLLIYGGIVYQLARIGYYKRLRTHLPVPREVVEARFLEHPAPPVTILVPSYKEEPRTVEQTLLSAAMQTYPNRRVVLLLDEPPYPNQPEDFKSLRQPRLFRPRSRHSSTISHSLSSVRDRSSKPERNRERYMPVGRPDTSRICTKRPLRGYRTRQRTIPTMTTPTPSLSTRFC